jgi:xylose isomerase
MGASRHPIYKEFDMNKLAVISAFLGGVKNRYLQYKKDNTTAERFKIASRIENLDGLELCYPADFQDVKELRDLLEKYGFGVPAINVRSRRNGQWLRGAFSSADSKERSEVVDDFKRALDIAADLGVPRISTCPLNDGHDYVFEINYLDAYLYAAETFYAISVHNPQIRVCIEYKWNDPRNRCLLASAGETVSFCREVGLDNLGVTLDIGHAILAGERPAQSVALLHRAEKLFYVHLNDNDRYWDWDMLPGAYNVWEFVEFFYYLQEVGYEDDWYAYDVMSKEIDTIETFNTVIRLTRKLEQLTDKIDRQTMSRLLNERNPVKSIDYLYSILL